MSNWHKKISILGMTTIGAIIATNKIIDITASANYYLPTGKGKYFKWKYGNIYYTMTGKGKPLLLIHDLDASSSSIEWNKVIRLLSEKNTVYTLDLLGCGRSDKPYLTYTNYLYVQLLNDFIKKVIGSRTNVAATGKSLSFTIMACHMENQNYNKIIGVSPCDLYKQTETPDKKRNIIKQVLESPVIGTYFYNIETSKIVIKHKLYQNKYNKKEKTSDKIINTYYKASKNDHSHGKYLFASIKSKYTNINMIKAIKNINNSVCLIGGRLQPFIHDIIDEYKAYNSSIEEAYISGAGYLPQLEEPEKFAELLQIIL